MGAFRFGKLSLAPGQKVDYILLLGVEQNEESINNIFQKYNSTEKS